MAEVQAVLASSAHSTIRQQIFAEMTEHLRKPLVKDLTRRLLINGGFASSKPQPKDVDLVLGLAPGTMDALLGGQLGLNSVAALAALEGKFSQMVGGHRLIHGFADDVGGPKYEVMREFLQRSDRVGEPSRKGILVVELN